MSSAAWINWSALGKILGVGLLAGVIAVPIGVLFALPALRTRGGYLKVIGP